VFRIDRTCRDLSAERCTAFLTNFMDDNSCFKYTELLVRSCLSLHESHVCHKSDACDNSCTAKKLACPRCTEWAQLDIGIFVLCFSRCSYRTRWSFWYFIWLDLFPYVRATGYNLACRLPSTLYSTIKIPTIDLPKCSTLVNHLSAWSLRRSIALPTPCSLQLLTEGSAFAARDLKSRTQIISD
jgi:hypothetical protein